MSFQKCPKCDGSVLSPDDGIYKTTTKQVCPVCNGRMIISVVTGLPPGIPSNFKQDSGDFRDGPIESQQEYFGK